jgi:uncharacterized membrane protein YdjX (TVP38/TMEM64 family)
MRLSASAIVSTALFIWLPLAAAWVPQPYLLRRLPSKSRRALSDKRSPITETEIEKASFFSPPWANKETGMTDRVELPEKTEEEEGMSPELMGAGAVAAVVTVVAGLSTANNMGVRYVRSRFMVMTCTQVSHETLLYFIIFWILSFLLTFSSLTDIIEMAQHALKNPSATLDSVVQSVEAMGPLGPLYFGVAYTIAEILAIPAIPLTASAGYLFGPVQGTTVVLISASIAASVSFVIGRTLLRNYVESVLLDYPKFAKIDRAIGKEGFKLMLLLRLSPIFPFALSNYLYGASSINFKNFFWGTLLGFAPGTAAFVYTGYVGKALTVGGESTYPWFVYAGGLAVFAGVLKVVADTATRVVEEMEDDI